MSIDNGLVVLIRDIWRNISENPPILEKFIVRGHQGLQYSHLTDDAPFQPQMDILTVLIKLMWKPNKAGLYAKEPLIIALAMKDKRIDTFLLHHSNFLTSVIGELTKKFQAALEHMTTKR